MLVATDNSTVVAYINKQGGTHSAEMCALLWKIMTWCHHYQITLRDRHIPGCLNVMGNLLSRSNRMVTASACVQTDLSKKVHSSCRPVCHSSDPQTPSVRVSNSRANSIDALNINWSGLTTYAYPPTALLHRVIKKSGNATASSL